MLWRCYPSAVSTFKEPQLCSRSLLGAGSDSIQIIMAAWSRQAAIKAPPAVLSPRLLAAATPATLGFPLPCKLLIATVI